MDWSHVLGWGSPIGLGVFFLGTGTFAKNYMHRMNKNK